MSDVDLLNIEKGVVTAPAGCGKTQLIADALLKHQSSTKKPILILTHTNAGVAALKSRLDHATVSEHSYRLATIDGWAIKIASTFPKRAEISAATLELNNPKSDYPAIRKAAAKLIHSDHINDILRATYSRLIVDEYQDCSTVQHDLVCGASKTLPTCILGDPLQAIFGFGSDILADWNAVVCKDFVPSGELKRPWRWINAGAEDFGNWLLRFREDLQAGKDIDLGGAPKNVTWVQLSGQSSDHELLLKAARTALPKENGNTLIIGDSIKADSRHKIASGVVGAVTVEAVELRDLLDFARNLDLKDKNNLAVIAYFAQSAMANVGATDLLGRVISLIAGTARKDPSPVERAAIEFVRIPTYEKVADLLEEISKDAGVRTYRPALMNACYKALRLCTLDCSLSFYDAAVRVREQSKLKGRPIPARAIGSTLLLKGLEADVCVVLNADDLDIRNLYVAMTRGSTKLVVCSKSQILTPKNNSRR